MHVLVIPAWYDIGDPLSGIFFHDYCNAMASACKVTLLDLDYLPFSQRNKERSADRIAEKNYLYLGVEYRDAFPAKLSGLLKQLKQKKIFNKIAAAIQEHSDKHGKIDIIHLQSACNNCTPWIAKRLSKKLQVPYLITEHYTSFREAGDSIFQPFTDFNSVKRIVNAASCRIAVSKLAKQYYKEIFGSDFEVVYNIIPDSFIDTPIAAKATNDFTWTCIGALQKRKGQELLIRAFAMVEKQVPNSNLILAGDGPDRSRLEELVSKLDLTDKVKFTGQVTKEDVISIIDSSDIIVSASEKETFGLSIAEAFMRGKPVVSTRSGGPEELIHPDNGLLCGVNDVNDLAEKMLTGFKNYSTFDKDKIRNEAIQQFSKQAVVPLMLNKYKSILNNIN